MANLAFKFQSVGPVNEAQIELRGLTVITGGNNTGKTYLAHSVYGLLRRIERLAKTPSFFAHRVFPGGGDEVINSAVEQIDRGGEVRLSMNDLQRYVNPILELTSQAFSKHYDRAFGGGADAFTDATVTVTAEALDFNVLQDLDVVFYLGRSAPVLSLRYDPLHQALVYEALEGFADSEPEMVKRWVTMTIASSLFRVVTPGLFISSAERTGAVIFQREWDRSRSKLIEAMADAPDAEQRSALVTGHVKKYPAAVVANVDFIRSLPDLQPRPSDLVEACPEVEDLLNQIVGGGYDASSNQLNFVGESVYLPVAAASSTIRSLVDLWFYLMRVAKKGDVLIIDEPELNLHPQNQRLLARLLALVHNQGLQILITTHSDYIVRELSALVSLSQLGEKTPEEVELTLNEQGITRKMALQPEFLNVYSTSSNPAGTVSEVEVTDAGIEPTTFDDVISAQNELSDMVAWGADVESNSNVD